MRNSSYLLMSVPGLVLAGQVLAASVPEDVAKELISDRLSNTPACIVWDEFKAFPVIIDPNGSIRDQKKNKFLEKLVSAGILSVEKKRVEMKKDGMVGMFKQTSKPMAALYSLTDEGKKHFREDAIQLSLDPRTEPKKGPGICYADSIKLKEIESVGGWSVTYYIELPDRAEWSKSEDPIVAYQVLDTKFRNVSKGQQAHAGFEYKDNAWFLKYY